METYTAAEFLARMASGALQPPAPLELLGLAKPDESDPSSLAFSPTAECTHWHAIPAAMIEGVQPLRTIVCQDHTHPLVRLLLRRPASEEVAACILYDLLLALRREQLRVAATRAMAEGNRSSLNAGQGGGLGSNRGPGLSSLRSPCIIFHGMEGLYVCCPPEEGIGPMHCTGMV